MTNAVADLVDRTAAPFQALATKPKDVFEAFAKAQAVVGGLAGLASAPVEFLNDAFARGTSSISKALPCFPAATMTSPVLGIPHVHTHPPGDASPLPGIGAVVTGCASVWICGKPAARSGDLGIAPTCGSAGPVVEIFTGSSKVFIGGARAARMGDFTRECTPAAAAGAGQAVSKLGESMATADKVSHGVATLSLGLNIAGAALKIVDTQVKRVEANSAAKKADAADAAAADAVNAQAQATAAAAESVAAAIAAGMMGASLVMDAGARGAGEADGKRSRDAAVYRDGRGG